MRHENLTCVNIYGIWHLTDQVRKFDGVGVCMPPIVIMKGKRMTEALRDKISKGPEGTKLYLTEKG